MCAEFYRIAARRRHRFCVAATNAAAHGDNAAAADRRELAAVCRRHGDGGGDERARRRAPLRAGRSCDGSADTRRILNKKRAFAATPKSTTTNERLAAVEGALKHAFETPRAVHVRLPPPSVEAQEDLVPMEATPKMQPMASETPKTFAAAAAATAELRTQPTTPPTPSTVPTSSERPNETPIASTIITAVSSPLPPPPPPTTTTSNSAKSPLDAEQQAAQDDEEALRLSATTIAAAPYDAWRFYRKPLPPKHRFFKEKCAQKCARAKQIDYADDLQF